MSDPQEEPAPPAPPRGICPCCGQPLPDRMKAVERPPETR